MHQEYFVTQYCLYSATHLKDSITKCKSVKSWKKISLLQKKIRYLIGQVVDMTWHGRIGQDKIGQDKIGQDRTGQDSTAQERRGEERRGEERRGQY